MKLHVRNKIAKSLQIAIYTTFAVSLVLAVIQISVNP